MALVSVSALCLTRVAGLYEPPVLHTGLMASGSAAWCFGFRVTLPSPLQSTVVGSLGTFDDLEECRKQLQVLRREDQVNQQHPLVASPSEASSH